MSWWKAKRRGAISRVPCQSCVVEDPRHVWKLHAREPGDLGDACCLTSSRTAGEGSGRTTRMHVTEESDSGIVPMNHSNKIEQSMAESEEGRPLIKENTHQSSTRPNTERDTRVTGAGGCAESEFLIACRQSSEIRAVCANERSYGFVRGAISNDRPYRDLTDNGTRATWTKSRLVVQVTFRSSLKRGFRQLRSALQLDQFRTCRKADFMGRRISFAN